jgi:hypothetical protein
MSPQNPLIREGKLCLNRVSLEINVETLYENLIIEDILIINDAASFSLLDWKTFTDAEWDTFTGFEWDTFLEE